MIRSALRQIFPLTVSKNTRIQVLCVRNNSSSSTGDSKEQDNYDLVVVGGGSGGLACAKEAASLGKKVAVLDFVDPSPQGTSWGLGGTCVNVGCIPKKLCHHSSLVGSTLNSASKYGWEVPENATHNWEEMMKNVNNYVRSLNFKHRVKLTEARIKYINAKGRVIDSHTVQATTKSKDSFTLKTQNIVIATGKRPRIPNVPGARESCITSDDIFWRRTPPGKTLCIGAGYVSLEIAGFLQGLGYETTVMARSTPLSKFDRQMSTIVMENMTRHGTKFLLNTMPEVFKKEGKRVKVTWRCSESGVNSDVFDTVLIAIGRTASQNLDIGLQQTGVNLDFDGCIVGNYGNERERSSVPNIYAIGDVLQNGLELTPVAARAGKLLARRMFKKSDEQMDYESVSHHHVRHVCTATTMDSTTMDSSIAMLILTATSIRLLSVPSAHTVDTALSDPLEMFCNFYFIRNDDASVRNNDLLTPSSSWLHFLTQVPTTVFTPVEYGFVGMSEELALATFGAEAVEVYHAFYKPLEYTVAENNVDDKSCYMKVLANKTQTQEVLGIHFTGPHAGEVIQGFAVALKCGLTFPKLVSTVGIHPTVAEEFTKLHITKRSGEDPNVTGC